MPTRQEALPGSLRSAPRARSTCVFCGRAMTAPNDVDGTPIHPDCFTRMCVAALVAVVPTRRWVPYLGWSE
jgi:hypothetical protein